MRGGLGRILLTAFMLMAIVPLSVVSYLAVRRVQQDLRQAAVRDLSRTAAAVAAQLQTWLALQRHGVAASAAAPAFRQAVDREDWATACGILQDLAAEGLDVQLSGLLSADEGAVLCFQKTGVSAGGCDVLSFNLSLPGDNWRADLAAIGCPDEERLCQRIDTLTLPGEARVSVVDDAGRLLLSLTPELNPGSQEELESWAIDVAARRESGSGSYRHASGQTVAGAFVWMPDWDAALIVEQPQETVLAQEDDFAAMLVGSTLAAALLTTVLAAVVTRRLTRPIVRLTRSAVRIAGGDLDQTVDLARRDEIGILAQAFNIMTAELRSLYSSLEGKVAERTRQLSEANLRLRDQTMQLTLSAEIGRVATSILDIDLLLERAVRLIVDSYADLYGLSYACVLLTDEFGEWVELQAHKGRDAFSRVARARVGEASPIGQTAADGQLRVQRTDVGTTEVVVPLRLGVRIIGVLDMCATRPEGLDDVDAQVLQSLGDQLSVAIENARIYAAERDTVQRLSRLDHSRLASLGVGARELATELNTIIGFSRLILKGVDGPLSDVQRADLMAIYKSGYRLLGLIDNVITLSELESGAVHLEQGAVDLNILLDEVVQAARQHLVDVGVQWQQEGPMPGLHADVGLLRQAFLGLVMAAAEQACVGQLTVRAVLWQGEVDRVVVSVGPNGAALLSHEDARKILDSEPGTELEEMSVGLSLARKVIELHQGQVWFWFDADRGLSSLTVLPVRAT